MDETTEQGTGMGTGADPTGGPTDGPTDARAADRAAGTAPRSTGSGFGRVLVAVYGVVALAATARAGYQIATKMAEAPLAYLLSALAAVVYLVATVALARGTALARRVAWTAVVIEATGVLSVGALSLVRPELFPDATVWSGFGQGYGYLPLVLPFVGMAWLRRTRPGR